MVQNVFTGKRLRGSHALTRTVSRNNFSVDEKASGFSPEIEEEYIMQQHGSSEQANFDNIRNFYPDFDTKTEKCFWTATIALLIFGGSIICLKEYFSGIPVAGLPSGSSKLLFSIMLFVLVIAWKYKFNRLRKRRMINWTLNEFGEELKYTFIQSPIFSDVSGLWRLAFRHTAENKFAFGLIGVKFSQYIRNVIAEVEINCTIDGIVELDLGGTKFVGCYECDGDCASSLPISPALLKFAEIRKKSLSITCKINFEIETLPFWSRFVDILAQTFKDWALPVSDSTLCNKIIPVGIIDPENASTCLNSIREQNGEYSEEVIGTIESKMAFKKHPETKINSWIIPNFAKHLKTMDSNKIMSPQFCVNSHDFCSIWRLQLLKLQGVIQIRMQLLGLPTGISHIKMRHLVELTDKFGEYVTVGFEDSHNSTILNPSYFHVWSSCFVPLYHEDAIVSRFTGFDDILLIRASIQCEPNDTANVDNEHGDWILHN